MTSFEQSLKAYSDAYEALTPATLDDLSGLMSENVEFKDPFNHHFGREEVLATFKRMYDRLPHARFHIYDSGVLQNSPNTGALLWQMTDEPPEKPSRMLFEGASFITFDEDGRVIRHIDHWDAASQFYERLPVIGTLIRVIKKRV